MLTKDQIYAYFEYIKFPLKEEITLNQDFILNTWQHHISSFPISSLPLHVIKGYTKEFIELTDCQSLFKKLVEKKHLSIGYQSIALFFWVLRGSGMDFPVIMTIEKIKINRNLYSKHEGQVEIASPVVIVKTNDGKVEVRDPSLIPFLSEENTNHAHNVFDIADIQENANQIFPPQLIEAHRWLETSYRYPYINSLFIMSGDRQNYKLLTPTQMREIYNDYSHQATVSDKEHFFHLLKERFGVALPSETLLCEYRRFFGEEKKIDKFDLLYFRHQQLKKQSENGDLKLLHPRLHHSNHSVDYSIEETIKHLYVTNGTTLWVSIAGPAAVGKTTFAKKLESNLEAMGLSTIILGLDSFNNNVEREKQLKEKGLTWHYTQLNFTDLHKTLKQLKAGSTCDFPVMDQLTKKLQMRNIDPNAFKVIILEGIYSSTITKPIEFLSSTDFSIFMIPEKTNYLEEWKWNRELLKAPDQRRTPVQFKKHIEDLQEDYEHHIKAASRYASVIIKVDQEHNHKISFLEEPAKQKIKLAIT